MQQLRCYCGETIRDSICESAAVAEDGVRARSTFEIKIVLMSTLERKKFSTPVC